MKVVLDQEIKAKKEKLNAVSFTGYKRTVGSDGFKEVEFAYPFDSAERDCYLEIYSLGKDFNENYLTKGEIKPRGHAKRLKLNPGSNKIDMAMTFGIDDNTPFAYHYVLTDKHGNYKGTRLDSGSWIDERKSHRNDEKYVFNLVIPTNSKLSKGGAMKLVIIDSQNVGKVYDDHNFIVEDADLRNRAMKGVKTLNNKLGGTLAGLEEAVSKGQYDNYGRIISLPLFTDDDFSSHAYWNKNCMQMVHSLGNINNYASFQRTMFAHGLNFVSDGAFVNEGLEGVHFKDVLKWGEESPYYRWFRASGLKDNPLSMSIFAKNKEFISHKLVNPPILYTQSSSGIISSKSNPQYDSKKPTYIQFFDTRLTTEKEKNDTTSLIKSYSILNTPDIYDLHSVNDSIQPYYFEINPKTYAHNIEGLQEYNSDNANRDKIDLSSYRAARILSKFETFTVENQFESGFETWDANPDIAKLNFVYSNADNKSLKNLHPKDQKYEKEKLLRANYQVQDYAVQSGIFWTRKTDDILRTHVAQALRNVDKDNPSLVYKTIVDLSDGKIFPKNLPAEVSFQEVENVLSGHYHHKRPLSDGNKKEQIIEQLMNLPLDSIEYGDNIVAALGSPMVSKRASTEAEIGLSRYEVYKAGNKNLPEEYKKTYTMMDRIYTTEMYDYASKVLKTIDEKLPEENKLFDGDEVTTYGKYVLPLIVPQIAKYAIVRSLTPNIEIAINKNTGEMSYDYRTMKETYLQGIGITKSASAKDEAEMLLDKIRKGIGGLKSGEESEIVESIYKTLKYTSLESFQLADLIIDKTQSGLDWRIDATKDIADVESLRNNQTNFEHMMNQITGFWKKFAQGVIKNNDNSYIVAEVTDMDNLHSRGWGSASSKYPSSKDIIAKFLRETGITSTADYDFLFSNIPAIFSSIFETGVMWDNNAKQNWIYNNMITGDNQMLKRSSLESIIYSYTFIGNHDKPRALHCAAVDLPLFYCDLTYDDPGNYHNREKAYRLLNDKHFGSVDPKKVDSYDYSAVSPKAVAVGYALRTGLIDTLKDYKDKNRMSQKDFDKNFIAISKAIADLSQGKYNGRRFDPDSFGVKPFDVSIPKVIHQATKYYNFSLPSGISQKEFENESFRRVIDPAISKLLGMMKYLVALPGMPTLFDGDDAGATGYDSKTKNMFLQGRQRIHDEWFTDEESSLYKKFIADHKKEFDEVMGVRKNPNCNPLNNGAPFMLPLQRAKDDNGNEYQIPAILRQSTDGRMTISLFNGTGFHNNYKEYYSPKRVHIDTLSLNFEIQRDNKGKIYDEIKDGGMGVGISGLDSDMVFANAKNPNDLYYVNKSPDGKYYIKHGSNNGVTVMDDTTLILYSVPKKGTPLSFCGHVNYTPCTNYVSNVYSKQGSELGKNLLLVK